MKLLPIEAERVGCLVRHSAYDSVERYGGRRALLKAGKEERYLA